MELKAVFKSSDQGIKADFGTVTQLSEGQKKAYEKQIEKLTEDSKNAYEDGFKKGKSYAYNSFWDAYQNYGKLNNYSRAFGGRGWTDETFDPKYNIVVRESAANMFAGCMITDLEAALTRSGVTLDVKNTPRTDYMFYSASNLPVVPALDISGVSNIKYMFYNCKKLHTIRELTFSDKGDQELSASFFYQCTSLRNLRVKGIIGTDVDLKYSPLSKDSIYDLIFRLSPDVEGNTITFSKAAIDKEYETKEGLGDGSASAEWSELCKCRPMWNFEVA